MDINEMTIGQVKEMQALLGRSGSTKKKVIEGGIRIVVLQRGWVVVGKYSQVGHDCTLTGASVIRVWGTKNGLPELVSGPIDGKTVLDKSPTPIRFHELTVVLSMDCVEDAWLKYIH